MTTNEPSTLIPNALIEALRDACFSHLHGRVCLCRYCKAARPIVTLLPPPKRWTDEDEEMVMGALDAPFANPKFGYTIEDLRRQTEAVLTALDEAGRLAPLEEQ